MKKILQKLAMSMSAVALLLAPVALVAAPAYAAPDVDEGLCEGANLQVGATDCNQDDPEGQVNDIITTVINIFSLVVGVVSVIMIIIGGLKYITSGGDSGNVSGAKNTILYAIVGLVVVALAQVIVRFVLTRVTDT
jgi:cytochrome bd-type quinol oxidase subunit 2